MYVWTLKKSTIGTHQVRVEKRREGGKDSFGVDLLRLKNLYADLEVDRLHDTIVSRVHGLDLPTALSVGLAIETALLVGVSRELEEDAA